MSDFGAFENYVAGADAQEVRQIQANRDLATVIHVARRDFGSFLSGAHDAYEWNDRLTLIAGELAETVGDSRY